MNRFLNLLNKYGLIENYHDIIPFDNHFEIYTYLGILLEDKGLIEEDIEIIKKWQDSIFIDGTYCSLIFFGENLCDWSDSKIKYILHNFSYEVLERLNEYMCWQGTDYGINAALKTCFSDNKIICILDGLYDGLSVEEIKEKIKEELPEKEW